MTDYALLVSARAKAAYFDAYLDVCKTELMGVAGTNLTDHRRIGAMDFLVVDADAGKLNDLLRLSFVHGIFSVDGPSFMPVDSAPQFRLHEDFVFGAKYRGKTNETLTQLLINIGLQQIGAENSDGLKLLDPMCGRGTTLLWGMRYGMHTFGVEDDAAALTDLRRHLKKWTKLHRVKHHLQEETQKSSRRRREPVTLVFEADDASLRLELGDTTQTEKLARKKRFDLIVSDLPYGIEHQGPNATRNPLDTIRDAAPGWAACLRKGGTMVLSFNRNLPKRPKLEAVFQDLGLTISDLPLAHRMSESIVRDVLVVKKTA